MAGALLLPFALFWRETLGRRAFFHYDLQAYFYPYHKAVVDVVRGGALPLWNPYAFSGIPLLGDGQTAVFYPPNWLFFALPTAQALTLVILLHFALAGAGGFLYVRSLGMSRLAASVAGLTCMFGGFLVARVVHPSIMAGAALIPLVFWGVERLLQRGGARGLVPAAAAIGLQALSGHPQIPIYTALGVVVYALVIALHRWRREGVRGAAAPLARLTVAFVAGYALAAVQLVPWIEFAASSPRAAGASYAFVTTHSLSWLDWLLFLFPYGFGGPRTSWLQSVPPRDPVAVGIYVWERLGYVGLLPLALAGTGLAELARLRGLARRGWLGVDCADTLRLRYERLWALSAVLAVMLAISAGANTPAGPVIYAVPILGKLRAYSRAVSLVSFVLAVLAAYGIERLAARGAPGSAPGPDRAAAGTPAGYDRAAVWSGILLILSAGGIALLMAVVGSAAAPDASRPLLSTDLPLLSLQLGRANADVPLALAVLSAAVLWWLGRGLTRLKVTVAFALMAIDLLGFAATFNPTTDPAAFADVPASVAFLRGDPSLYRTASYVVNDRVPLPVAQDQLTVSWAVAYGFEDVNGFNSLQPRRYTDFLFGPQVEDVSYGLLRDPALLRPDTHLLSMLDVKYVLVQRQAGVAPDPAWAEVFRDENVAIYRNPVLYGRAYFVGRVSPMDDPRQVLDAVRAPGFEPRRQALVEGGLRPELARALSLDDAPAADGDSARVTRVSPNELRIDTQTARDRFLVLSEMWSPGWRAEIDGREVPLYRTDYLFRGLAVPAGRHTVRVYYRPTSVLLGAAVTGAAIVGLIGALAVSGRRPGQPARPPLERAASVPEPAAARSGR